MNPTATAAESTSTATALVVFEPTLPGKVIAYHHFLATKKIYTENTHSLGRLEVNLL